MQVESIAPAIPFHPQFQCFEPGNYKFVFLTSGLEICIAAKFRPANSLELYLPVEVRTPKITILFVINARS